MDNHLRFLAVRGQDISSATASSLYFVPMKVSSLDISMLTSRFRPKVSSEAFSGFGKKIIQVTSPKGNAESSQEEPDCLVYLSDRESLLLVLHVSHKPAGKACETCIEAWKNVIGNALGKSERDVFGDTVFLKNMPEMIPLTETNKILIGGSFSESVKDIFRTYKDVYKIVQFCCEKKQILPERSMIM